MRPSPPRNALSYILCTAMGVLTGARAAGSPDVLRTPRSFISSGPPRFQDLAARCGAPSHASESAGPSSRRCSVIRHICTRLFVGQLANHAGCLHISRPPPPTAPRPSSVNGPPGALETSGASSLV